MVIDELDRGWDGSEDARQFVAGLFQAVIILNRKHSNLSIVISLRRELYDNIPEIYEDAQKVRDLIRYITWDEEGLKEIIGRRISAKYTGAKHMNAEEAWNFLFRETLQYRKSKSYNYIVDRTLYRPREIIQFCNDCIESVSPTDEFIDYDVISRAEIRYSEDRLQDIAAEYRFQYPGLREIFETFRGSVYTYDRERLETHCLEILLEETVCRSARGWLNSLDEKRLIRILWQIGFLRALSVGGQKSLARSGSRYLGPYQVSSLNLDTVQQFHVHPMFRAFLAMKEK